MSVEQVEKSLNVKLKFDHHIGCNYWPYLKGPHAPLSLGGRAQATAPKRQSAAHIHRAPYRLFRLAGPPFR